MAIRGAGASEDGPGGLKTGVLRQFKVGFAARSERPPATSILTVIKRDFEVLEGQNGSKRVQYEPLQARQNGPINRAWSF